MKKFPYILCAGLLLLGACKQSPKSDAVDFSSIDGKAVLEHIRVLASDEYEGRAPGTKGEDLTVGYIESKFREIGLLPGNTDGTYIQKVPLAGITLDPATLLTFEKGGQKMDLRLKDDFVAWTRRVAPEVRVEASELVFVGYGVEAPEFDWDDYKGIDVKGKTLVMLVGDPPIPDPENPSRLDPKTFGGKAMTYYGRWTYKYEIGARLGAAAVLIVHETEPAAYPFAVVQAKVMEQATLVGPDGNLSLLPVEGWLSLDSAEKVFALSGLDYKTLKETAVSRDFRPVAMGTKASVVLRNTIRSFDSRNVVAQLEGSDPVLKDEFVIYTAHWDHLGMDPRLEDDKIFHGARDNASGIGGMIELARAFKNLPAPPKRSILFLATTSEEQGLLGSDFYAGNPIYPLAKTAAVINMDGLNTWGRTKDITVQGIGQTDLDGYVFRTAARQGRMIVPDPTPEKGGIYRSDHFPFMKRGVPVVAAGGGIDYIGKPADFGKTERSRYNAEDYHKPSDVINPKWETEGFEQELQFYGMVGYEVCQAAKLPEWRPGSEFKTLRDAMLQTGK